MPLQQHTSLLQPTAGITSNPPGCYALTRGLGRAASPAKARFVSGAKDQAVSISEHTFVSFGCTLSGITCLPRQTRSYPGRHRPAALLQGLHRPARNLCTYCIHIPASTGASSQRGRAPALRWLQQGCCREQRKELEADSWSGCCLALLETGVENWHRHPATPTNTAFICRAAKQTICQLFIWRTGFTSLD